MNTGFWIRPTGRTVTLPDGREAREVSAFLDSQGGDMEFLASARVENWPGVTGCLADTPEGLLAIKALPFSIGKRHLEGEIQ